MAYDAKGEKDMVDPSIPCIATAEEPYKSAGLKSSSRLWLISQRCQKFMNF
jgi:hypothetical protein